MPPVTAGDLAEKAGTFIRSVTEAGGRTSIWGYAIPIPKEGPSQNGGKKPRRRRSIRSTIQSYENL